MDGPTLDPQRIVDVFASHEVDYLLVGGVGAQQYGATRQTLDIDFLASFQRDNLERLCRALAALNARLRVEGISDREAIKLSQGVLAPEYFQRAEITTLMTDAGPLDVLHDIPARDGTRLTFEDLRGRGSDLNFGEVRVRVAALADIVASKEWANRPKDREALPELHALQSTSGGGHAPPSELD